MKLLFNFFILLTLFCAASCTKDENRNPDFLIDPEFELLLVPQVNSVWIYANSDSSLFDTVRLIAQDRKIERVQANGVGDVQIAELTFESSQYGEYTWTGRPQVAGKGFSLLTEFRGGMSSELYYSGKKPGTYVSRLGFTFEFETLQMNNKRFRKVKKFEDVSGLQSVKSTFFSSQLGLIQRHLGSEVWTLYNFSFVYEQE